MSVVLQALAAAGCAGALLTAVQATRALRDAARRRRSTGEAGARRRREFQSVVDETCRSTRQAALARPQEGPAPAWQGWRQFVVAGKAVEEASDIVTFHLVPQDGRPLPPFLPGQYVTVQLRIAGAERPVVRCYSLSCAPRPDRYEVSVKRVGPPPNRPDLGPGRASGHLHDQVRAGDVLDLQAPRGTFGLDPAAAGSRVVLIGGGVGLTPLLSVAQSLAKLAQAAPGREVWLFHGVRNGAQRLRRAELQHLAAIPGFRVAVCLSQPGPGEAAGPPGDPVTVLEGLRAKDQLIVEGFETLRGRAQVKIVQ